MLPREQVRVIHGGNAMWRRLDILTADDDVQRSYTMMVSGWADPASAWSG